MQNDIDPGHPSASSYESPQPHPSFWPNDDAAWFNEAPHDPSRYIRGAMNERFIRASYDEETITVYQAFGEHIGLPAVTNQSFLDTPFKQERMTWIKPSFLWMMYRSGWGSKPDQECVLAVRIKRSGFDWALRHSALSTFNRHLYADQAEWQKALRESPVRIQWDPEKNIHLQPLPYRSIQIGISGPAVRYYVNDWIVGIENVTDLGREIRQLVRSGATDEALSRLPVERPYPLNPAIAERIGCF